jgi:adenylate cyclase
VLIGVTAMEYQDYHTVPFSRARPGTGTRLMSGIEVHANVLHTILRNDPPRALAPLVCVGLLVALVLASTPLFAAAGLWVSAGELVVLLAGWLSMAWVGFRAAGVQLPVAGPVTALLLNFVGFTAARLLSERSRREHVEGLFGKYVSDHVVRHLLASPAAPALGGERRVLTVLFSDIRGFTATSESLAPERVTGILNAYLTKMEEVIFSNGGTVDKYIGDGIMAVFNWPLEQPDHAARAVRTAVGMLAALDELHEMWHHVTGRPIAIGVGIHTGPAVVGNIGSPRRMELTAIGDAVNVASRVEQLTKALGTAALVTEDTYRLVKDQFPFGPPRSTTVPGRSGALNVYPVLEARADDESDSSHRDSAATGPAGN